MGIVVEKQSFRLSLKPRLSLWTATAIVSVVGYTTAASWCRREHCQLKYSASQSESWFGCNTCDTRRSEPAATGNTGAVDLRWQFCCKSRWTFFPMCVLDENDGLKLKGLVQFFPSDCVPAEMLPRFSWKPLLYFLFPVFFCYFVLLEKHKVSC